MFIKNIIINGFRSYREQSFGEELSPRNNVIVGRNGSGKSNFFAAIQFVLSEKYSNLRANERKELFHVGAGRAALSVFVEIVFDNTDGRLVIPGRPEESEVRIRRTIGLKQDEYRVNDRKFTLEEVRQLLESAGFSSSNPYYIVEQGKIVQLANMREEDRFELLKEVAGTRVYENRRAESIALLDDAVSRQHKIDESIDQLDARLRELESETTELKAFQAADRKRRSLEFCVFDADVRAAQVELEALEAQWNVTSKASNENRDSEAALEAKAAEAERGVEAAAKRTNELEVQRKRIEKARGSLQSRQAMAKLKSDEAISKKNRETTEKKVLAKEEEDVVKAIKKSQEDLKNKKSLLLEKQKKLESTDSTLQQEENRLAVLQAKRGRKGQFSSKNDRDKWLQDEIRRTSDLIQTNEKEMARLKDEIQKLQKQAASLEEVAHNQDNAVKNTEAAFADTDKERKAALKQRDALNGERRKIWQQISDQEGILRRKTEEMQRAQARLDRAIRPEIRQGIKSLAEVLHELNDPALTKAVHGQVIELMEVEPEYLTAVEVTAGNTLFHVVVDSFDVSAKILDHMNKRKKPGRLSFFPLDTCKSRPMDLPTTAEYSPLLSHVKFAAKFKSIFAELFGKTVVARTLESGAAAVSQFDADAITLEGDQFNRKGGITGGFTDRRNGKLVAFAEGKATEAAVNAERAKLDELRQKVAEIEQGITGVMQQLELLSSQDTRARYAAEEGALDARSAEEQKDRINRQIQQQQKAMDSLLRSSATLQNTVKSLQSELKTDLQQAFTAEEEKELERLQSAVGTNRAEATTAQSKIVSISTEVEVLESTVQHLERRLASIRKMISSLTHADVDPISAAEAATLEADLKALDKQLADIDAEMETAVQNRRKFEEEAEQARRKLLDSTKVVQASKDDADRVHTTRALLMQKKEDAQAKIRKLGIIPPEAEKFTGQPVAKLLAQLKQVNDELKKFGHVNKKAVDQYAGLQEARTDLNDKREGLRLERKSIDQLITDLDKQRGEAIERTYKQVQFQFEEVFKELVNAEGASAQLQMVKAPGAAGPEAFTAVRVKVSFGLGAPVSELSQLSGGQKSLVALALIFAIQRSDPAPFYLFDEIDAALDAEYRTSVARLLSKQSEACQFITASFKTEMVEAADQVYGIFFSNKVSRIHPISHEDGVKILKQAAMDEASRKRTREDGTQE